MKNILLAIVFLALYAGSLFYKNIEIEKKKATYIPTTYDLQKKNGIPVVVDKVLRDKFQEFITITGKAEGKTLSSSVAPFVKRQIKVGSSARLELEPGHAIEGRVTKVSASPSLLTGLYEVTVVFNQNLPKEITSVTLDIPVKEVRNVLVVRREAVSHREEKPFVFSLEGNNIKKKYIEIAGGNSEFYWIRKGLEQDETVVTSDTRYFAGGELVQVVNETRNQL